MTTKIEYRESPETGSLLSSEGRAILSQVADTEAPHSQRAQALLAIDEGATYAEASHQAGLTKGQLRYWLGKFRKDGTSIFPEELVIEAQPEQEESQQELQEVEKAAEPVDDATAKQEDSPMAKKQGKKKSKKKSKKAKKSKKDKKKKKGKKSKKKSKKKGSKKAKGDKGKSGKKAKKKDKK